MSDDHDGTQEHQQERIRLTAIDAHVGARIRLQRKVAGMTANAMGDMLGVRYQQVHYYEIGKNRVSAGNIYQIAEILNVPVSFFFDGIPEQYIITQPGLPDDEPGQPEALNIFSVSDIKAVEDEVRALAQVYYLIAKQKLRKGVIEFLKIVGREM